MRRKKVEPATLTDSLEMETEENLEQETVQKTPVKRKRRAKKSPKKEAKPKVERKRKIRIKEAVLSVKDGLTYYRFVDPPEELLITPEHINMRVEVAGLKKEGPFKLKEIRPNWYTVVDGKMQYRSFDKAAVILIRDVAKRNTIDRVSQIMTKKVTSKMSKRRRKRGLV